MMTPNRREKSRPLDDQIAKSLEKSAGNESRFSSSCRTRVGKKSANIRPLEAPI